jgi:hypothetical protein
MEQAIEATGLEKSYRTLRVLDGIDLEVARGSVFALLGPNGPARPRPSGSWPPWSGPTPAGPGWPASTWSPTAARCGVTSA